MTRRRHALIERDTAETRIRVTVDLDGGDLDGDLDGDLEGGKRSIDVPSGFFGHMLDALATHGGLRLEIKARGDTQVDLHHTVEDVGICLGKALRVALGARRDIVRFAHAYAPLDEALARAVVDLSGRGFLACRLPPEVEAMWITPDFPVSLLVDFFRALADNGRLTLHLEVLAARNGHHAAEAAFKAVALALRQAIAIRAGGREVPSTKGTLTA